MPDVSGRDQDIFVLNLYVRNNGVVWTKSKCSEDGSSLTDGPSNYVPLDLDLQRRNSIKLLTEILEVLNTLYRDKARLSRSRKPSHTDSVSADQLRIICNTIVRNLGAELFKVLFKKRIYQELCDLLKTKQSRLTRIRLEFDTKSPDGNLTSELSSYSWEYLRIPDDDDLNIRGQFLALNTDLALTRRLSPLEGSLRIEPPVKILLVVASPDSGKEQLPWVDGRFVSEKIKEAFGSDAVVELIQEPKTPPKEIWVKATYEIFKEKVKSENPHIIHLIAHGQRTVNGGEIAFSDASGAPKWISAETLGNDLGPFGVKRNLKLVFLQACESALPDPFVGISSVAQFLALRGVPAVVGMQAKIEQEVAGVFAHKFYQHLASREPVDVAVKEGRQAINSRYPEHNAFALPVTYLASYESLIGMPKMPHVSRGGNESNAAPRQCPRCNEMTLENCCPNCGLWLNCHTCKRVLPEPLRAKFCGKCGHPIVRQPSPPDVAASLKGEDAFAEA